METVLITGGCGFVGKNLIAKLHSNYNIIALDNFNPQVHAITDKFSEYDKYPNVDVVIGSVQNTELMRTILPQCSHIIHLAAETGTNQSMYNNYDHVDVNCGGTAAICDAILSANAKIKSIILTSSRAIYGEGYSICPVHGRIPNRPRLISDMVKKEFLNSCPLCGSKTEPTASLISDLPAPTSTYGASKLFQELQLKNFSHSHDININILRLQNVYGPSQSFKNPYTGIIPLFISLLSSNLPLNVYEDGNMIRDFVHVDDCVSAIEYSLASSDQICCNVGSGEPVKILSLVFYLKQLLSSSSHIYISGDFRKGDIRANFSSLEEISLSLPDWTPKSIFTGIEEYAYSLLSQLGDGDHEEIFSLYTASRLSSEKKSSMIIVRHPE